MVWNSLILLQITSLSSVWVLLVYIVIWTNIWRWCRPRVPIHIDQHEHERPHTHAVDCGYPEVAANRQARIWRCMWPRVVLTLESILGLSSLTCQWQDPWDALYRFPNVCVFFFNPRGFSQPQPCCLIHISDQLLCSFVIWICLTQPLIVRQFQDHDFRELALLSKRERDRERVNNGYLRPKYTSTTPLFRGHAVASTN